MRVAILGASGIGKFHARDFSKAGCEVVAILGRTRESAHRTASMLKETFGISPVPYHSMEDLFKVEKFDMVSICLPPDLHESAIQKGLERGLHVFCEKPLLEGPDAFSRAKVLFDLARSKGVHLGVNLQWASFPSLVSYDQIDTFEYSMEPGQKGRDMLLDQLCHATSVLQKLVPQGSVKTISIDEKSEDVNTVSFDYVSGSQSCRAKFTFRFKKDQPRALVFTINGDVYARKIGPRYEQSFVIKGKEIQLDDPFTTSIARFVSSVQGKGKPLLTELGLLHNVEVQEALMMAYDAA